MYVVWDMVCGVFSLLVAGQFSQREREWGEIHQNSSERKLFWRERIVWGLIWRSIARIIIIRARDVTRGPGVLSSSANDQDIGGWWTLDSGDWSDNLVQSGYWDHYHRTTHSLNAPANIHNFCIETWIIFDAYQDSFAENVSPAFGFVSSEWKTWEIGRMDDDGMEESTLPRVNLYIYEFE